MNYEIFIKITPQDLEEKVRERIKAGWVPQGGVVYQDETDREGSFWAQAMIKE